MTIFDGAKPASSAMRSSPGLATSQPMPHFASSRSTGTSDAAFAAKVCSTPGAPANASWSAATDSRTPSVSTNPATGLDSPSRPAATAWRTAAATRAEEGGADGDGGGLMESGAVIGGPTVSVQPDDIGAGRGHSGR